ncbi:MAG TPA: macro domain-containing protein, partial [Candidatus Limnocylindria bacterium]|nr:macro domain-containing protein [Candidatus Limnocylindria bacterium]
MAAPIEIDVWQGEIAELEVDAIVVSANESLFMNAGPAAAVMRRGGEEIERAAVDQGPVAVGSAVVTGGGSLAAPYVIHAVGVGHDRVADLDRLTA